jgi:hypothetical protein
MSNILVCQILCKISSGSVWFYHFLQQRPPLAPAAQFAMQSAPAQQHLGVAGAVQQLPPAAGAVQPQHRQHATFAPGIAPKPRKNKKTRAVPPMMQGSGYAAGVVQQHQVDFGSGTPFV